MLSGAGHAAAGASAAAVAAEQAALPPTLETSSLLKDGDTVTGIVLVFSKPLDPATAQVVYNYQVTKSMTGIPFPTITAAVYDASRDSVTLMLAQPFTLPRTSPGQDVFTVFIPPFPSITDASGQSLIAGTYGQPGSILCNVPAQGTAPNPLVNTYSQARLNAVVSKIVAKRSLATANAAHTLHLAGTVHGTYTSEPGFLGPDTTTVWSGSISPLGRVASSDNFGSPAIAPNAQLASQGGFRQFRNKRGSLELNFYNLRWANSHSVVGDYSIFLGTGAYAGAVGSGHVQVTWKGTVLGGKVTDVYS